MAQGDHGAVLASIQQQQRTNPLSILNQAEPILASQDQTEPSTGQRGSTSSVGDGSSQDAHLTPAALAADLEHYQSLFSKLRFSYLEQVTKEKYLRSIVGDPPILVTHEDNIALEERLVNMKSELKAKKENIRKLVENMEALAKDVATRHEEVNTGVEQLEKLPQEIESLEAQVAAAKALLKEKEDEMDLDISDNPRLNLGMQETQELLDEQQRKIREVNDKIDSLQKDMPSKVRECERSERELEELETKKNEVTRLARELRRLREEGGRDMLEEQGRWYKSSEAVLRGLLEIPA